jgi:hypothetical protein
MPDARTPEQIKLEIEARREELAKAVDQLRDDVAKATDVKGKLAAKLPIVAAGAIGAGFFVAGGVGATFRLFARRGREGETKARLGRFSLVDHD